MPTIQLEKHLFTEDKNPEVVFCVKVSHGANDLGMCALLVCHTSPDQLIESILCPQLPVLCSFQNVTYTLIISHEGGQVLELSRQFSYSSGYNSECIEVLVTEGLQEGTQYTVQVFMDAGLSGSSYSDTLSFRELGFLFAWHSVNLEVCRTLVVYTVEPPKKGHFGSRPFVLCSEVVPISEVHSYFIV